MIRIQEGLIKIVVIVVNDYTYSIENRARPNSKVVSADMPERFRISVSILNSVSFFGHSSVISSLPIISS